MAKKAELDILEISADETADKGVGSPEGDLAADGQNTAEGLPSREARTPEGRWYQKRRILIPVAALLVILVAGSGLFLKHQGFRGSPGTVAPEKADSGREGPSRWVPFHEMIIPVKDGQDRDRILRLDFFVEVERAGQPVAGDWIRQRRNDIYQIVRQVSFPVPVPSPERKKLKEILLRSLSPYFGKNGIKGIYFTELFFI